MDNNSKLLTLFILGLLLFSQSVSPTSALPVPGTASIVTFDRLIGNGQFDQPYFNYVWQMAANETNLFVTDYYASEVHVMTLDGQYLTSIGETGTGNGDLTNPIDTIFFNDQVVVGDYGNDRIEVFDMAGNYVQQLGTTGTGDNQFSSIQALSENGTHLFVSDYTRNDIVAIDTSYSWHGSVVPIGSSPGQVQKVGPFQVTDNFIYVYDSDNHLIDVFDLAGNFVRFIAPLSTQTIAHPNLNFHSVSDMVIHNNLIYIVDADGIKVYTLSGEFAGGWFYNSHDDSKILYSIKLMLNKGKMYVTDTYGYTYFTIWNVDVPEIQVFAGTDNIRVSWGSPSLTDGANITAFNVYRGTNQNDLKLISSQSPSQMSFVDTTAVFGNVYYYAVSAVNEYGETNLSPAKSATLAGTNVGGQTTVTVTNGNATVTEQGSTFTDKGFTPLPIIGIVAGLFVMAVLLPRKH